MLMPLRRLAICCPLSPRPLAWWADWTGGPDPETVGGWPRIMSILRVDLTPREDMEKGPLEVGVEEGGRRSWGRSLVGGRS